MSQVFKYIIQGLFKKLNLRVSYINDNRPRYIKAVESMGINLVLDTVSYTHLTLPTKA